jgi:GNAT superfamily N-acetyltransferase
MPGHPRGRNGGGRRPDVGDPDVVGLDATDAWVAEAIRDVMAAAYAVEAALLGVADFPPLRRTAAQIAASDARFIGVWAPDAPSCGAPPLRVLLAVAEVERMDLGRVHLNSLVVRPSHVRRGLASALLRSIVGADPAADVTVDTGAANVPALLLYAAHGFVAVRRWTTAEGGIPMVSLRRAGGA